MGALQRYIFRLTGFAFLAALLGTTAVVWMSQTFREFDLITAKGQSFWTFLAITLLAVPSFSLLVAPLALFGGVVYVLNRLNTDSELAAMNAAGARPATLLTPLLALTLIVGLVSGALSISAIPATLRMVREMITEIRADVLVRVLQEGEFTRLDKNLTFHVRSREAGAALTGILIEDGRDANEDIVYTAERGQVLKTEEGTFLVLEKGAMQRKGKTSEDVNIVLFDRYAFDLSPLADNNPVIAYKPKERYISELWNPSSENEGVLRRVRAEIHERLVTPFYPLAFMAVAFAALARPQTTRQSRVYGIGIAILTVFGLRVAGLGLINLIRTDDWAVPVLYALLVGVTAAAFAVGLGIVPWFRRTLLPRTATA